jgi:hypothetical protein
MLREERRRTVKLGRVIWQDSAHEPIAEGPRIRVKPAAVQ